MVDKISKDPLKLENLRSISLLKMDNKIATKTITNPLHIFPELANINQTVFMKGRFTGDTIRTLLDVIEYCKSNNEEGLLMMIYFEKLLTLTMGIYVEVLYKSWLAINVLKSFTMK